MRTSIPLLVAFATQIVGFCQKPLITPGGVVNAASYAPFASPGSVVAIFGENLAQTTLVASSVPLPNELGGTSVTVGGVPAYLFFVSPSQIDIQVPSEPMLTTIYPAPPKLVGPGGFQMTVTAPGGTSDQVFVQSGDTWGRFGTFGIFTQDASGCGRGQILNVAPDRSTSLNSPNNSAAPGDYLTIYGTGLGYYAYNSPPDGKPTPPAPPLYPSSSQLRAGFDYGWPAGLWSLKPEPINGISAQASWAGRAPGFIGLDQVNVQIPLGVREGCAVPLQFSGLGFLVSSQPVPVSIRTGGGACVDPPSAAYGQISWERAIVNGSSNDGETDSVTVAFPSAPGLRIVRPTPIAELVGNNGVPSTPSSCKIQGYRNFGAGAITAQAPGRGPIALAPDSQIAYHATLSNGTVAPGTFTVSGAGAEAGAFQSSVQIGSPITITTPLPPGTVIPNLGSFTVNWTGGDPDSWVTMTIQTETSNGYGQARASAGTLTFYGEPVFIPGKGFVVELQPVLGIGETTVTIEVTPDPSQTPVFSIPGVSLGTVHSWKYTYRFEGLVLK
jgi:uncharacterized protein (TIGR03437 family)